MFWCFSFQITVFLLFAVICGPGGDWAEEKDRHRRRYESLRFTLQSEACQRLNSRALHFYFAKKKTKPSTQNRSTNQNAGDHKVSANFHVFLGCGWPRLSAHHSWMAEENNYKEGQHRLHDLIWVRRVITRALCHGGNLLCRNYSRCNFKGSREFRRGRLWSSTQRKALFFAFVELMRGSERERVKQNQKNGLCSVSTLVWWL